MSYLVYLTRNDVLAYVNTGPNFDLSQGIETVNM